MEILISTLGWGRIELLLNQSAVYFVVVKYQDIYGKIIPFLKALDYSDFKQITNIVHNKEHLTKEGIYKIQSIKSNMNLLRKIN